MEKITINYRLDDYIKAYRILNNSNWLFKISFSLFLIRFAFDLIKEILANQSINFLLLLNIILYLIVLFSDYTIIPLSSKLKFNQDKKCCKTEITLIFTEGEIKVISSILEGQYRRIYNHILTPKILLIFIDTPFYFTILPKKYCINEEQYEKICSIVTKLPSSNESFF